MYKIMVLKCFSGILGSLLCSVSFAQKVDCKAELKKVVETTVLALNGVDEVGLRGLKVMLELADIDLRSSKAFQETNVDLSKALDQSKKTFEALRTESTSVINNFTSAVKNNKRAVDAEKAKLIKFMLACMPELTVEERNSFAKMFKNEGGNPSGEVFKKRP